MAGKNIDWNRRAGTLRVDIFKRAKVAYATIDYLVILYGGYFYLYITDADSSFYGHSHEYDFEKAGYNATGYKKIILKRDKEVIVSVTSKKILTKKQMEKRTRADPLAVGLGDQEIKEVAHDFYIEDRDDKLRSLCNTFESEARKLVATDNSVYTLGSNSSGDYGVCTKMDVKGKPIYKTKIGKTSKRTSLSISMCGRKSTVTLTIPAEPKDTIIPQPASSQVSLPGMNEPLTLGSDTDVNSPTPNDNTETVATTEELVEIDITSVNDGKNYVTNAEAYAKYGYVERVVDFSEVESENQLLKLAKIYAKNMQYDEMVMDISALDLHTLNNNIDSLALASDVRCISIPHDLDIYLPVTEISIPLDDPSQVRYTLGASGVGSMSSSSTNSAKLSGKRLNDKLTRINSDVLEIARAHMSSVINQKTTGYVNIIQGENGSEAIVISSEENWKTSKNLWKFDMNGLAYSEAKNPTEATVANREWKIGMTMEGQIVADFINTGVLSDGQGLNYWNLTTGEFSILNTLNSSVSGIKSDDSIGGDNLLYDSDAPSLSKVTSSDDRSKIDTTSGATFLFQEIAKNDAIPTSAKNKIYIFIPKNNIRKTCGICFYKSNSIYMKASFYYTISCWAKGVKAQLVFKYGVTGKWYQSSTVLLSSTWTRYSHTFQFRSADFLYNNNCRFQILIYPEENSSACSAEISSFKLEFGSRPTTWCKAMGEESINIEIALAKSKQYATSAANAVNKSMTHEKIFNLLTNNGTWKGLVTDNTGDLYINADYIKSGTLHTDVLQVTVLGNNAFGDRYNHWDLSAYGGLLQTYNMRVSNAQMIGGTVCGQPTTTNNFYRPKQKTSNHWTNNYDLYPGYFLKFDSNGIDVGYAELDSKAYNRDRNQQLTAWYKKTPGFRKKYHNTYNEYYDWWVVDYIKKQSKTYNMISIGYGKNFQYPDKFNKSNNSNKKYAVGDPYKPTIVIGNPSMPIRLVTDYGIQIRSSKCYDEIVNVPAGLKFYKVLKKASLTKKGKLVLKYTYLTVVSGFVVRERNSIVKKTDNNYGDAWK